MPEVVVWFILISTTLYLISLISQISAFHISAPSVLLHIVMIYCGVDLRASTFAQYYAVRTCWIISSLCYKIYPSFHNFCLIELVFAVCDVAAHYRCNAKQEDLQKYMLTYTTIFVHISDSNLAKYFRYLTDSFTFCVDSQRRYFGELCSIYYYIMNV